MAAHYVTMGEKWNKDFLSAVELDGWGQVEEAREKYEAIADNMQRQLDARHSAAEWTDKQKQAVRKLKVCLRLRSMVIKRDDTTGINCENMKALSNVFDNLFKRDKKFPIDLDDVPEEDLKKAMGIVDDEDDTEVEEVVELLEPVSVAARPRQQPVDTNFDSPASSPAGKGSFASSTAGTTGAASTPKNKGGKQVVVHVQKIGLKDYDVYVDPYVSVTVVSGDKTMESWQDTEVSKSRSDRHIIFDQAITLKSTYESILPGAAIMFEFKHFKEKKSKISTRCWTFLEREDLKEGIHLLELYKKPLDLKRKKLSLHSVKQLYLNVQIEFR